MKVISWKSLFSILSVKTTPSLCNSPLTPTPQESFLAFCFLISGSVATHGEAEAVYSKLIFRSFEIINLNWLRAICQEERREVCFWGSHVGKNCEGGQREKFLQTLERRRAVCSERPWVVRHVACSFTAALQAAGFPRNGLLREGG